MDVLGEYRLQSLLGQGGMGLVYLAEHTRDRGAVALKVVRPELATNPRVMSRFMAEARAMTTISSPHVVAVKDVISDTACVMELLDGETLASRLQKTPTLSARETIEMCLQITAGLAAVHDAELVHCDLKPDNVFLHRENGRQIAKLIDFGIAKLPDGVAPDTDARGLLGTPAYMSPEQIENRPFDHTADLYSFGVLAYRLLTGAAPFVGDTVEDVLAKHLSVTPPPPSERAKGVPQELDALIMQCLAKQPQHRPASAQEVEFRLTLIRDAIDEAAAQARRERKARLTKRVAVLAGVACWLVAAAWFVTRPVPAQPIVISDPPIDPQVSVVVDTTPSGATIVRDGLVVGTTPKSFLEARSSVVSLRLELRLDGYTSVTREIVPNENMRVVVELAPLPKPVVVEKKRRPKKLGDRDAVLDPFAN